ncbi:hypothetical protein I8752_25240 [Nostocaceae cyanobacterium CENA369]|uniref:Uncharacterized protein n=1 Tax=Dendronalium phyllosphericum CENA369 TaxID=1725256 RepID=A0A8J7IDU6_9NOST|nr:hypothetical protein [Dendronalium phyllosphericum]MBH8576237.1 hypothetical protein [Dendronalium phyllosphericum CENA369]
MKFRFWQGVGGGATGVVFKKIEFGLRPRIQHLLNSLHPTPHTLQANHIKGLRLT